MFSTNRVKTACFILLVILVLLLVYVSAGQKIKVDQVYGGDDFTGEDISSRERRHSYIFQGHKDTGKGPGGPTRHKHPIRDIDDDDITKFMVPVGEEYEE